MQLGWDMFESVGVPLMASHVIIVGGGFCSRGTNEYEPRGTVICARGPPFQCVVELPQQLLGHWLREPCVVGTGSSKHQIKCVITHFHILDPFPAWLVFPPIH